MAVTKKVADEGEQITEETLGEIVKEKVVTKTELGGAFTFRLPHALDTLAILRRRAEIVGVPESLAGGDLLGYAHALAMFQVLCVHEAPDYQKLMEEGEPDLLDAFMEMMEEVRDWQATFRGRVGRKKV